MDAIFQAAFAFGVLLAVFLPLERLFPAHRQGLMREQWSTDALFFLGQYLVWATPVVAVLVLVQQAVSTLPVAGVRHAVAQWPFWLQFVCGIGASDLATYWAHRWAHRNRFLWRFHRVHHTAERLDWLAAHREHPLDNLYTRLVENLPLILIGFPLHAIAGFAAFRGLWAIYIHANVAVVPGPLRFVLGASRLHHWHHERQMGGSVNFANVSPLMDLVFGTYHDPGRIPERYGVAGGAGRGFVELLVGPVWPWPTRRTCRKTPAETATDDAAMR